MILLKLYILFVGYSVYNMYVLYCSIYSILLYFILAAITFEKFKWLLFSKPTKVLQPGVTEN